MVRQEETGSRESDLLYSSWHRTLPNSCYMINLDSIEWRNGRGIVAFIETAIFEEKEHYKLWQELDKKAFEIKVLSELSSLANRPAFLVLHTPDLSTFYVFEICNEKAHIIKPYSKFEYSRFLISLGTKTIEVRA